MRTYEEINADLEPLYKESDVEQAKLKAIQLKVKNPSIISPIEQAQLDRCKAVARKMEPLFKELMAWHKANPFKP